MLVVTACRVQLGDHEFRQRGSAKYSVWKVSLCYHGWVIEMGHSVVLKEFLVVKADAAYTIHLHSDRDSWKQDSHGTYGAFDHMLKRVWMVRRRAMMAYFHTDADCPGL